MKSDATYPIAEALKAQTALRDAAGLPPEQFPIEAVVGMMSDEIEALRKLGRSDEEIASLIGQSSAIRVDAATLTRNYATPQERHARD